MPHVTCQYEPCSKQFYTEPCRLALGWDRYCSMVCKQAAKPQMTCQYAPCSKVFSLGLRDIARDRKYCSKACKYANQGRPAWQDQFPPGLSSQSPEYLVHYRAANHQRIRAKDNAYASQHRAEAIARTKAWEAANPAKAKANRAATARRHPETGRTKTRRYRSRKRQAHTTETINYQAIYARDKWICQLCHEKVDPKGTKGEAPSPDHVIPLSQGGADTAQNIVLTHWRCNRKKQARAVPQQQRLFG